MLSAFADTILQICFINHISEIQEKTPRLEGISWISKPCSRTLPITERLDNSLYMTFLQFQKQWNLSSYSWESSSKAQLCALWTGCWISICSMWHERCPETVGCLYQTFLYNQLKILWTSLSFSTQGFGALYLTGPTPELLSCTMRFLDFMFKVGGAVGVNMTLITLLSCSSLSASFLAAAGPHWADACSC